MQIKLNYTYDELTTLLDGLNNAILAVQEIYGALQLGCAVPKVFSEFEKKSFEEINELVTIRKGALLDLYQHLLQYEAG